MDGAAHPVDGEGAIARRYGATAAREWEHLRTLLDFATGFSLVVLIVPDADGAALCHRELAGLLGAAGRSIRSHLPANPAELRAIAATLPHQPPGPDIGAVWVECVVPASDPQFDTWRAAWRRMLEGLNQQRNPLRETFPTVVIFVAAPWLVPLFRECAPDLWSVRSQVVRIELERVAGAQQVRDSIDPPDWRAAPAAVDAPDPDFALAQAARLPAGNDLARARLLIRAAQGHLARGQPRKAEAVLTGALALPGLKRDHVLAGIATHELGRALLDQGRASEAEAAFRRALASKEEGEDSPASRGLTAHGIGRALLDQGLAAEAEAELRSALALEEEGGDTPTSRGVTTHELGRALMSQGRAADAEAVFRRALSLAELGGDPTASRGIATEYLGRALRSQGRAVEAEAEFRRARALKESGGDTATSLGIATHEIGRALLDQGRAAEAEAAFRQALTLMHEGGARQDWIDIVQKRLDEAIQASAT